MLAVIDQGGYGAQAAAPLVRNIFDYIVANPLSAQVKTPTPANPPSQTAPDPEPAARHADHDHDDHGAGGPAPTTTTTPGG